MGAPQGMCIVTIIVVCIHELFVSHCNSVQMFKFADDTTLIGLITNDNESNYRREVSTTV